MSDPVDRFGIKVGVQITSPSSFVPSADLAIKTPVRVATTAALTTLAGFFAIDGVTVVEGDRVLVKDQADQTLNGIYNATSGPWARSADANGNDDYAAGQVVLINAGTLNVSTIWQLTSANPVIVGTTALTYTRMAFPALGSLNTTAPILGGGPLSFGLTLSLAANGITYALFQQVAAASIVGNPTGSLATAQAISLGATLAFSASSLQTAALTGDISTAANSFVTSIGANKVLNTMIRQGVAFSVIGVAGSATANVADISTTTGSAAVLRESGGALGFGTIATAGLANNSVTYAKLQQVAASSLVGNATGSLANATDISIGATLAFSGAALQTVAMTGDISTSANSFATAIGANKVLNTMIRQGAARSVIGVTGNATANVADIAGTANQVLVVNSAGTALAFGQVNLAAAAAVTGTLPSSLGGTDNASYAIGDLLQASASTTLARLAAVATGNVLISGGVTTVSSWGKVGLTTHVSGTLAVGNGGTGATTLTIHGVLLGQTTGAIVATAAMTDGQLLVGQTSADPLPKTMSGDATLAASGAITLGANVVTYAKFQQVAASSLVGNATGSLANATGITLGATLTFSGAALQTLALTGDVTAAANSFATTVAKIQGTVVSGTTGSANVVFSTGASLTSPAIGGSPTITGLPTPTGSTDAANKAYVDSVAQGLSAKPSAIVATAAALPTNTYSNGASGVGATITFTATGVVAVDGHNLALNDVVLVKNEVASANNGLYTVTLAPAVGVAGILTRHTSMDTTGEFDGGFVFVEIGTVNAAAGFVCTNSTPPTVGTTAIAFTQFSGAGEITVTAELTKTGNQLSITANGVTYAMLQQVAASSLVGNATGSLANATGITLGATLAFSGAALQTAAHTGDVTTSANSFATTVAKIQGTTVSGTTGTGNVAFSASPTFTGTITAAALTLGGTVLFTPDNTYDIGASAASRPANVYVGTSVYVGSGGALRWASRGGIFAAADGIFTFYNNAITSFGRIQLGGTTASFASIKANGAAINFRLADDTGDAAITAGATTITGSFTATNLVTNASLAQMAASTLKGNATGGTANAADLTIGATLAFSGSALQTVAHTGDVTTSANSFVTTIAANAVTNAKMATMATLTIKSNITGGSAVPSDNTLTSILDTLTTTQGSIIYRGASNWAVLSPGTDTFVLTTHGASANPTWAAGGGGGGGSSVTDGWVEHGHFGGI